MTYKIAAINNHTHEVTLSHQDKSVTFTVPPEHRAHDLKKAYIKDQGDALVASISVSLPVPQTLSWWKRVLKWLRIM